MPIGRPRAAARSTTIAAEIRGEIKIPLDNARIFTLAARADRIERRRDGSYAVLDYKTGQPPTGKQVRMGLSPQLTLEAAILREGGFAEFGAGGSVAELAYVRLSGNNPPGEHKTLELKIRQNDTPQSPDAAADYARARNSKSWSAASKTRRSPIARWCCRCGRRATAITTISPASRNGPLRAASRWRNIEGTAHHSAARS